MCETLSWIDDKAAYSKTLRIDILLQQINKIQIKSLIDWTRSQLASSETGYRELTLHQSEASECRLPGLPDTESPVHSTMVTYTFVRFSKKKLK